MHPNFIAMGIFMLLSGILSGYTVYKLYREEEQDFLINGMIYYISSTVACLGCVIFSVVLFLYDNNSLKCPEYELIHSPVYIKK